MTHSHTKPLVLLDDLDTERHRHYLNSRYLAVDTETLGLKPHRDRLCVVQMCNEDGLVTLVQTHHYQAPLLKEVLEAAHVEKIFHYARFDLAALYHWLGCRVGPVFCTKIASRLARTYTDKHGLKYVVKELVNVDMNKEQQSSDWAAQTLSDQQVAYAATDVVHLIQVKEKLEAMLTRENRLDLAHATMACLPTRVALDLAGWADEDIFAHT